MKLTNMICLFIGLSSFQSQAAISNEAYSILSPKSDSKVIGTFNFKKISIGLEITYELTGLTPYQTFGLHIHDKGDCSSTDAKSAGGHFFKIAAQGGTSTDFKGKYAGDLNSIYSDATGKATGSFTALRLTVAPSPYSIIGRSIVLHSGPDNVNKKSASRIACGVIEVKAVN